MGDPVSKVKVERAGELAQLLRVLACPGMHVEARLVLVNLFVFGRIKVRFSPLPGKYFYSRSYFMSHVLHFKENCRDDVLLKFYRCITINSI